MAVTPVLAGLIDAEPLADVLQAALWDDPLLNWMLPDDDTRSRRAAGLFEVLIQYHYLPMHSVWTTSDTAGAALWSPPEHWRIPLGTIARHMHTVLFSLGRNAIRSLRLLDYVDGHHPTEPHWYLGVLGTNPPRQGQGIGSELLRPVLDRCDRDGTPAYLESSTESNIGFYARHGFVVTGEMRMAPTAPVLYPMRREPRPN